VMWAATAVTDVPDALTLDGPIVAVAAHSGYEHSHPTRPAISRLVAGLKSSLTVTWRHPQSRMRCHRTFVCRDALLHNRRWDQDPLARLSPGIICYVSSEAGTDRGAHAVVAATRFALRRRMTVRASSRGRSGRRGGSGRNAATCGEALSSRTCVRLACGDGPAALVVEPQVGTPGAA